MKNFDLLIFDCDGVLVDSEPISALAHKVVYAKEGLALSDSLMSRCVGMKQKDIFNLIASETGVTLPEDGAERIWQEVQVLMEDQLKPTDGILTFLTQHSGNRCVASSSSMERIKRSLKITVVDRHFSPQQIFSSSMVQRGKPAPDLFLHAAASCGTSASACAVFEDSVYGIQGAVAAGMQAFGYTGGSHCGPGHAEKLKQAGATAVFASWREAQSYLQG